MISLEKLKILVPLQKLPKNVEDMGKLIVAKALKSCHSPINRPIWSHWSQLNIVWTANSRHCFALWPLMSSIFLGVTRAYNENSRLGISVTRDPQFSGLVIIDSYKHNISLFFQLSVKCNS